MRTTPGQKKQVGGGFRVGSDCPNSFQNLLMTAGIISYQGERDKWVGK